MSRPALIVIRHRCLDRKGEWETEWAATAKSWRKAWAIADETGYTRDECRKWQTPDGSWRLDIGGTEEKADRVNAHAALMVL